MWSFEVLANITSIFSLYCNSTNNGNNNMTVDDICIKIKILISKLQLHWARNIGPDIISIINM